MKILLDENLPTKLKNYFTSEHEIKTVREMKWLGKKNGELMELITLESFEAFVTLDKNLRYQQNLSKTELILFILFTKNNRVETLRELIIKTDELIASKTFSKINEVR